MGLTERVHSKLSVCLVVGIIAWVVQLLGLIFLQRSCTAHKINTWQTGAQLPAAGSCRKIYRWIWWAVLIELPIVVGLGSSLFSKAASNTSLRRFRLIWISLLIIATVLQMWSANIMLNLTDSIPSALTSHTEQNRAKVTFVGFVALSVVNFLMIFILGDEGGSYGQNSNSESLLSESTA